MAYYHNGPYRWTDPEHDEMDDHEEEEWLRELAAKRLNIGLISRRKENNE